MPNQTKKIKLMQAVGMAYELSTETKADVFIDYHPHVNYLSFSIYKNGWNSDAEPDIEEIAMDISLKNLDKTIKVLQEVRKELEV